MSRIDALVNIDRKAWHACNREQCEALCGWRDFAEYAFGTPTESTRELAMVAIAELLTLSLSQDESDILETWKMMLGVKRAA